MIEEKKPSFLRRKIKWWVVIIISIVMSILIMFLEVFLIK